MTQRDFGTAATDESGGLQDSATGNDHEPEGGTPSQDGSIGGGMSSQEVDDTDDGAADESADDGNEGDGESASFSPKLQRKLKQGAEAMKKLSALETEIGTLRTNSQALETLLKHPNGLELLKQFRTGQGATDATQDAVDDFIPKDLFGFDPDTKKGLDDYMKSAMGGMVASLRRELQPVLAEVGSVKTQRTQAEWSELTKAHGEGVGKWKAAAEKASRELNIPLKKALAFVSDGEAMTMRAATKAAAGQAAQRLPTLTDSRGKMGAKGGQRVLATTFADFLEKTKNNR